MGGFSTNIENPIKVYIRKHLRDFYRIFNDLEPFVEDLYQLVFEHLWKPSADYFINNYFDSNGDLIVAKLTSTACDIAFKHGIYKKPREKTEERVFSFIKPTTFKKPAFEEPNRNLKFYKPRTLIPSILYASSLNKYNCEMFEPHEFDEKHEIDEDWYISFEKITPDFVKERLTPDELKVYKAMLEKDTKYYYNTTNPVYRALAEKIRGMKKGDI